MRGLGYRRRPATRSERVAEPVEFRPAEAFEFPIMSTSSARRGGPFGPQNRTAGSTLEGLQQNYFDTYGFWPGFGQRYRGYMSIPGAWRASVMLSDLFGSTPWHTYRTGPDGNSVRTPRNAVILDAPAGGTEDPVVVRASWALDYLWEGNMIGIYATRGPNGQPTSILPVPACAAYVRTVNDANDAYNDPPGSIQYLIGSRVYNESEIFHVKGPCEPGALRGMGVLEMELSGSQGALRLAAELDRQAGSIANSGVPTGTLETSNPEATPDDMKASKEGWLKAQRDRTIAALGPAVTFKPVAWNPEDMELVEARKFSLTQIELMFGLPVGWLGGATSSRTYSNIEQDAVNLLKFSTLAGMYARCESIFTSLIPRGQTAKANRDAILRSDTLTRYQAHTIATGGRPWATPDDIREIEDMAPLGGDAGQLHTSRTRGGVAGRRHRRWRIMTIMTDQRTFPGLQPDGHSVLRQVAFSDFVDLELRADNTTEGDGHTFDGIAVPYNVEIDVDGWFYEEWQGNARSGPFDPQLNAANRVLVGDGHIMIGGSLIGSLRTMANDAKGLRISGRISDVPNGNTALTLMQDKALRELSIGFYRLPNGDTTTRDNEGRPHIQMTRARLFEVALVPFGAYGRGATVTGLRTQNSPAGSDNERVTIYLGGREVASYRLARARCAPSSRRRRASQLSSSTLRLRQLSYPSSRRSTNRPCSTSSISCGRFRAVVSSPSGSRPSCATRCGPSPRTSSDSVRCTCLAGRRRGSVRMSSLIGCANRGPSTRTRGRCGGRSLTRADTASSPSSSY